MQKNENRLCPLPYEEVLEDIIKTVWTDMVHTNQRTKADKIKGFSRDKMQVFRGPKNVSESEKKVSNFNEMK